MKLLTQLQFSISGIFELYITQGRRFYSFSLLFAILSGLWSTIIGGIIVYIYFTISYTMGETRLSANQMIFESGEGLETFRYATAFIMILNMSLYALALNQFKRSTSTRISFETFFRAIPSSSWLTYILFAVGGILFTNLATDFLSSNDYSNGGSIEIITRTYGGTSAKDIFYSLLALLLQFSPVVLGFLLIHLTFNRNGTDLDRKDVGRTLLTIVITSFILYVCATELVGIVNLYLVRLISLPFQEPLIPTILAIVIYLFLIGIFYLGLAGAFLLPFLFHEDGQGQKRDIVLDEHAPIDEL
ncbi:MAG TPA: hypothetical protein VK151_01900 [Fluviicola sp.]|nr:hypothetical protein [Fluviicola sp.]